MPSSSLRCSFFFATTWLALVVPQARAQWPSNAAQNFSIADRTGEQVLPKIAATSDGGCYVGWFDQFPGSYEVRLQRLDARGVEQWPRQGILVSNHPQSTSLVDWDLIADRDDHCVLAFTDTRAGGDLDVYAYRIDPSGSFVWGLSGVALSANGDYEPNPRICETTNGDFVFAWANTGTADLRVQRLDRTGNALYPANGLIIPGDAGATPAFCRIVAADAGGFILSWVRALAFTAQKHVHAQKFDAAGLPLWGGGTRLAVFDLTSVPIAHEPRLLSDGSGGAWIAWHYALGSAFSVRVQHVLSGGAEALAHNGIDVCTNANSKFDPACAWNAASGALFVCWNERNTAQSQWGLSVQKVVAGGALAFGANGLVLLPVNGIVKYTPVCALVGEGVVCTVLEESLGALNDKLRSFRVSASGALVWAAPVDASVAASDKLRLSTAATASGVSLHVWTDKRSDNGDVVAQNVNPDGTLGDGFAAVTVYGCAGNPPGSLTSSGRAAIGTTLRAHVQNPLGTQAPGALALLFLGAQPDPNSTCGTPIPGFGMSGPGAIGESLIDFGAYYLLLNGGPWGGVGQPVSFPLAVPYVESFASVDVFLQGLLIDLQPNAVVPLGLTNGLRVTIGF